MKTKKALAILNALSQENRLAIFRLLIQEDKTGLSAGKIAEILQIPPATLSFHLNQLTAAGLLRANKEGRSIFYRARYKTVKKLMEHLLENSYKKRVKEEEI